MKHNMLTFFNRQGSVQAFVKFTYAFWLLFLKNIVEVDEQNFNSDFCSELKNEPESNSWRPDHGLKTVLISWLKYSF